MILGFTGVSADRFSLPQERYSAAVPSQISLKKFGAMLGDHVEVGCGSVLNPGTVIGRNSNIYPLSPVRGCVPADSIYKNAKVIVKKK